jgi:hypothetical protein
LQEVEMLQEVETLEFSSYDKAFIKTRCIMTKKNPFKNMSGEDWAAYSTSHEPHFTDEPYYELIPWTDLSKLETDAANAGWSLILRTTNNSALCPTACGYKWYQSTQWIFGYPEYQFLLVLRYTEDKFSLSKDLSDDEIPFKNYFSLTVVAKLKEMIFTLNDYHKKIKQNDGYESDDYYSSSNCLRLGDTYYVPINSVQNWNMNGGSNFNGIINFNYIYSKSYGDLQCGRMNVIEEKRNKILEQIPASFWVEWISNNKDILDKGCLKEVQMSNWANTYVLPGGQLINDYVLKWQMDFYFVKKLINSSISNWVDKVFGFTCTDYINSKHCILEVKQFNSDGKTFTWIPSDKNPYENMALLKYKDIRLSKNALILIRQYWDYVHTCNK